MLQMHQRTILHKHFQAPALELIWIILIEKLCQTWSTYLALIWSIVSHTKPMCFRSYVVYHAALLLRKAIHEKAENLSKSFPVSAEHLSEESATVPDLLYNFAWLLCDIECPTAIKQPKSTKVHLEPEERRYRKLALVGNIPNQILFSFSSDIDRRADSRIRRKKKTQRSPAGNRTQGLE